MSENPQIPLKTRSDAYYRSIFNKVSLNHNFSCIICNNYFFQYDRNQDGFITVNELNDLIESREYEHDIPPHMVKKIHEMHDHDGDENLNFQEFCDMINNPGLDYVFGHYVTR